MKHLFIIIPAYNAGQYLRSVVGRIPKTIWRKTSQVVVVDDGSTDNTRAVIKSIGQQNIKVHLLSKPHNEGYARAQKTGFSYALDRGASLAVVLHADGQYAPEELSRLIEPLERGQAEIVQGSRILGGKVLAAGMPFYKYVANRLLTLTENWVFGLSLPEYHSGYLAYTRHALTTIPFQKLGNSFHFDGEMLLMGHLKGLTTLSVPISTRYAGEKSYLNPLGYGIDVLIILMKYLAGYYRRLPSP